MKWIIETHTCFECCYEQTCSYMEKLSAQRTGCKKRLSVDEDRDRENDTETE